MGSSARIRPTSSPCLDMSRPKSPSVRSLRATTDTSSSRRVAASKKPKSGRLGGAVMDGRGERIGVNEAIFREVNERIEELAETFDLKAEPLDLVCECGNADCVKRITMTIAEYEAVRSESRQFAVFPGHEVP